MTKWYFTFCMDDDEHRDHYIAFEGSYKEARTQMCERFGTHWAFQYSEEKFKGQAEKFGLTEIK